MKSNRILILLLVIIIVFVGVAGWLYSANSRVVKQNNELTNSIASNRVSLNKGNVAIAAQQQEAAALQSELASAQTALTQINFRSSAESIKYDSILFSIAAENNLRVTSLITTPPSDTQENNNSYQLTTFTVNVAGITPDKIFSSTQDSAAYVTATVNNILAYVNEVANSPDFDTAEIPSVSITSQAPMTDADIATLDNNIKSKIRGTLTPDEIQDLTADQVTTLLQSKFAALKPAEIQVLLEQLDLAKPTATITIQIWVLKGA